MLRFSINNKYISASASQTILNIVQECGQLLYYFVYFIICVCMCHFIVWQLLSSFTFIYIENSNQDRLKYMSE